MNITNATEKIFDNGFLDVPVDATLDLFEEIKKLKKEKNAIVLAHYYQEPDIQDIADYIGDSLGLAQKAATTNADMIVFAGVHFMAETAKILNPTKKVLLPDLKAGCSLADSAPPALFARFKEKYPNHLVISYINCTAEIKALSDIICTSGNAEKIINEQYQNTSDKTTLQNHLDTYKLENSYIGILGKSIEPVITPLGYDWKIGIAVVTSFAAREVFVGTLATIYSVGDNDDDSTIKNKMRADVRPDGSKIFNFATGVSLLLFYAFAMQCASTVAITKKETNSWKWPLIQLVFMSGFAYLTALIAYQLLK